MIIELKKKDFKKCIELLNEDGLIEVKAIIEGFNSGRVFVDNPSSPSTGFVWQGNNDGFIFWGNENNSLFNQELNSFINKIIIPEAVKAGLKWFEALGDHADWNKSLERTFRHRQLTSWNQRVYKYRRDIPVIPKDSFLEKGYKVHKMNYCFYANKRVTNMEVMMDKV